MSGWTVDMGALKSDHGEQGLSSGGAGQLEEGRRYRALVGTVWQVVTFEIWMLCSTQPGTLYVSLTSLKKVEIQDSIKTGNNCQGLHTLVRGCSIHVAYTSLVVSIYVLFEYDMLLYLVIKYC